jgi:hypothetical protein
MFRKKIYDDIRSKMELKLLHGLSKNLIYHNVDHTKDVVSQSERIAIAENINDPEDIFHLKVAGIYHDSGYLHAYMGHEEVSCELAKAELPLFELCSGEIEIICGLIMATKVPQTPRNRLEEIICDADLDYFGREDFFEKAGLLFLELKAVGMISTENEWNVRQEKFLSSHQYFTSASKRLREPVKQQHLKTIRSMIKK